MAEHSSGDGDGDGDHQGVHSTQTDAEFRFVLRGDVALLQRDGVRHCDLPVGFLGRVITIERTGDAPPLRQQD